MSDMVKALQHSKMNEFKNSYRSLDALLVDAAAIEEESQPAVTDVGQFDDAAFQAGRSESEAAEDALNSVNTTRTIVS